MAVIQFSLSSLRYSNCTREILTNYFGYVNKAFIASQNLLSRCEKKELHRHCQTIRSEDHIFVLRRKI